MVQKSVSFMIGVYTMCLKATKNAKGWMVVLTCATRDFGFPYLGIFLHCECGSKLPRAVVSLVTKNGIGCKVRWAGLGSLRDQYSAPIFDHDFNFHISCIRAFGFCRDKKGWYLPEFQKTLTCVSNPASIKRSDFPYQWSLKSVVACVLGAP